MESGAKIKELTPERVVQILHNNGTEVTLDEAAVILAFMRRLACITVRQILSNRT